MNENKLRKYIRKQISEAGSDPSKPWFVKSKQAPTPAALASSVPDGDHYEHMNDALDHLQKNPTHMTHLFSHLFNTLGPDFVSAIKQFNAKQKSNKE